MNLTYSHNTKKPFRYTIWIQVWWAEAWQFKSNEVRGSTTIMFMGYRAYGQAS
jgi:hypothetical protein